MDSLEQIDRQRAELESVLSSVAFQRAPNLTRLLKYICEKHWQGKSSEIKEYALAVEALARPADFDPLTNSIVRVELHRLREKLKHYYQDPGRRVFKIHLRSGTYVPEFVPIPPPVIGPPKTTQKAWRFPSRLVVGGLSLTGILALLLWGWLGHRVARASLSRPPQLPSPIALVSQGRGQEIRIMAGYEKGKYYVDRLGETWLSDQYYNGGVPVSFPRQVTALTTDPALFETARMGRFSYAVPLSSGPSELRLYFMERLIGPGAQVREGGENSRLFSVLLNGKIALSDFDPYADAGGNLIGHIRAFKGVRPGPDGLLRISFIAGREEPFLNAIEIIPTPDDRAPPIHIVAQQNSFTDAGGRIWESDRYYRGGVLVRRQPLATNTSEPDLYGGERYGHFSYVIPVPDGAYGLTVYFSEAYFGLPDQGMGGIGSRVFDLYCNGQALLRDFDVFREGGGANRALVKSFHGLKPNAQGQLALDFVPVKNYAVVNAIEVVDESRNH